MGKLRIVEQHAELPHEAALREWFEKQALASPDTLEAAAREIIGLVTALLGVLLGVTAIAGAPLPSYMWDNWVRPLAALGVLALLVALGSALGVVLPRRYAIKPALPQEEVAAFADVLRRKSRWLKVSTIAFGVGMALLGLLLIVALFRAGGNA